MPLTSRFAERIGKVFLPEPDAIDTEADFTPNPEGPELPPGIPGLPPELERPPLKWPPDLVWPKFCYTVLKPGCYTIGFTPTGTPIFGTRYRGTLRIEPVGSSIRMSGDLYSYRLFDDIIVKWPIEKVRVFGPIRDAGLAGDGPGGEAADVGGVIPIYPAGSIAPI